MTTEDLSLIKLFSQVSYQGKTVLLLKKSATGAILFDKDSGWISFYIPAADIELVKEFQAPVISTPPTSLADIPLLAPVMAGGESGVLIDKQMVENPYTKENYYTGLVWFSLSETGSWFAGDQIAYAGTPGGNGNGIGSSELGKIALYAGGAYLAYQLLMKD